MINIETPVITDYMNQTILFEDYIETITSFPEYVNQTITTNEYIDIVIKIEGSV